MTDEEATTNADPYIENLKAARSSPAVLKIRLAQVRSQLPDINILAFEGDEDKIVYHHWIQRIRPGMVYEPMPCAGKRSVFILKDVVDRDLNGLGDRLFFFVDRDFDDLQGHDPHPHLFMSDRYSVENYLVEDEVVDLVLKIEFSCHGNPEVRQQVLENFRDVYGQFLLVTRELNFRIYVARKLGIELSKPIPKRIRSVATVLFHRVSEAVISPEEAIQYKQEPSLAEFVSQRADFDILEPKLRYRGKFSLIFLQKWLGLLAIEYEKTESSVFKAINRNAKVHREELTLGGFAAKSALPIGLADFLMALP